MQQDNPENYITISLFERAMKNIASRFDGIDLRFNAVDRTLEAIMRELQSNRDREIVGHDQYIDGIAIRLKKLEAR